MAAQRAAAFCRRHGRAREDAARCRDRRIAAAAPLQRSRGFPCSRLAGCRAAAQVRCCRRGSVGGPPPAGAAAARWERGALAGCGEPGLARAGTQRLARWIGMPCCAVPACWAVGALWRWGQAHGEPWQAGAFTPAELVCARVRPQDGGWHWYKGVWQGDDAWRGWRFTRLFPCGHDGQLAWIAGCLSSGDALLEIAQAL